MRMSSQKIVFYNGFDDNKEANNKNKSELEDVVAYVYGIMMLWPTSVALLWTTSMASFGVAPHQGLQRGRSPN